MPLSALHLRLSWTFFNSLYVNVWKRSVVHFASGLKEKNLFPKQQISHQHFERSSMLYNPELSILGPIFFSSKFSTVLMKKKKRYSKPLTHRFFPPRFMPLCHLLIYLLSAKLQVVWSVLWKCYQIPTKRSIFKLIIGHNGSTMQATLAVGCVAKRRYYKMTIIFGG